MLIAGSESIGTFRYELFLTHLNEKFSVNNLLFSTYSLLALLLSIFNIINLVASNVNNNNNRNNINDNVS